VTTRVEARTARELAREGFAPLKTDLYTFGRDGDELKQTFECQRPRLLRFAMGFEDHGARLRLTVVSPQGKKYEKEGDAAFAVEAPHAGAGKWEYSVKALDLPYINFPARLVVAGANKVVSPAEGIARLKAALELAKSGGAKAVEAVPVLREVLKNEDAGLRSQAAAALQTLGPKAAAAVPDLVAALQDDSVQVRRVAPVALGGIGKEAAPAVPDLVRVLKKTDEDSQARAFAAVGLAMIGPGDAAVRAVPDIVGVFADRGTPYAVRERSLWALRVHGHKLGDMPAVLDALRQVLSEPPRPGQNMVRYDAAYLLGHLHGPKAPDQALDVLQEFLLDPTVRIYGGNTAEVGGESVRIQEKGAGDGRGMAVQALEKIGRARVTGRPPLVRQLKILAADPQVTPALREQTRKLLKEWAPLRVEAPAPPPEVQKHIDRGVQYLRGKQSKDGGWAKAVGMTGQHPAGDAAFAGLTLLECGAAKDDTVVQNAAKFVRDQAKKKNLTATYEVALALLFLDRLENPGDKEHLRNWSLGLVSGQNDVGGWEANFYPQPEKNLKVLLATLQGERGTKVAGTEPPDLVRGLSIFHPANRAPHSKYLDPFNTHFALLGLWTGRRLDLPLERSFALLNNRLAEHQIRGGQHDVMKKAMHCVELLALAVGHGPELDTLGEKRLAPVDRVATRKGLTTLGNVLGGWPREDPYLLWSVEQVAVLYDLKTVGSKDWYPWGVQSLRDSQKPDGSWSGGGYLGANRVLDTCFALQFLRRANLVPDLGERLWHSAAALDAGPDAGEAEVAKKGKGIDQGPILKKGKGTDLSPVTKALGGGLQNISDSLTARDQPDHARPGRHAKVYSYQMRAGLTYTIRMRKLTNDFDPYLRLEDAAGQVLAEDDDGDGFPNAKIVFTAPRTGVYRIVATSFDMNFGNYTLTVTPGR
jgi:hypothetical protein